MVAKLSRWQGSRIEDIDRASLGVNARLGVDVDAMRLQNARRPELGKAVVDLTQDVLVRLVRCALLCKCENAPGRDEGS